MAGIACAFLGLLRRCAPRNDGFWVWALVVFLAVPAHAVEPRDFAPGQLWSVKAVGAATMRIVVGKVEPLGGRTVVHVSVMAIKGFPDVPGLGRFDGVGHMPFDAAALARSVDRLLASDVEPAPDFQAGYATWQSEKGGVFTLSVPEAVDATWRNATQKGT
jgi:hypothetical protein